MSAEIRKYLKGNPEPVITAVSERFGIPSDCIRPVAGTFANLMYVVRYDAQDYILRLTPETHRSTALIESELHWIDFLAGHDVPVVATESLNNNRRLEKIPVNDSCLSAVCFKKAEGVIAAELDKHWDDKLFKEWGRVMGRMHAVTKDYLPEPEGVRRYDWYDDAYLKTEKYVPSNQPLVLQKFRRLKERLTLLDKDRNSYALIHADFHKRNFFVHNGNITLFDFDDCQYCWLAADIAVSLFSVVAKSHPGRRNTEVASGFLEPFLEGYAAENILDIKWLGQLPLFLKLREMINYIDGHTHWDLNNLSPNQKKMIERCRFNIENDIPVIDMDFTRF